MVEGPGWARVSSVIRGGGLRIQILAIVTDRTGEPVSEGKIDWLLSTAFDDGALASTGQLVDRVPGWAGKASVICSGGLRIQILAIVMDRTGEPVSEGKIGLAVIHCIQ